MDVYLHFFISPGLVTPYSSSNLIFLHLIYACKFEELYVDNFFFFFFLWSNLTVALPFTNSFQRTNMARMLIFLCEENSRSTAISFKRVSKQKF
jgi:hypothetical protein